MSGAKFIFRNGHSYHKRIKPTTDYFAAYNYYICMNCGYEIHEGFIDKLQSREISCEEFTKRTNELMVNIVLR